MTNELIYIIVAAAVGFLSSYLIEKYRERIAHEKEESEWTRQEILAHHAFLSSDPYDEAKLCPIARVIISTEGEHIKVEKIPEPSERIKSVQEIRVPTIVEPSGLPHSITGKPEVETPVIRRFYRLDSHDYAWYWRDTRDELRLLGKVITIGRNNDNDIVLFSTQVSRHHAVIRYEPVGYVFYDFALTNTTKINDLEVPYFKVLKDGDVLEIGTFLLEYQQASLSTEETKRNITREYASRLENS